MWPTRPRAGKAASAHHAACRHCRPGAWQDPLPLTRRSAPRAWVTWTPPRSCQRGPGSTIAHEGGTPCWTIVAVPVLTLAAGLVLCSLMLAMPMTAPGRRASRRRPSWGLGEGVIARLRGIAASSNGASRRPMVTTTGQERRRQPDPEGVADGVREGLVDAATPGHDACSAGTCASRSARLRSPTWVRSPPVLDRAAIAAACCAGTPPRRGRAAAVRQRTRRRPYPPPPAPRSHRSAGRRRGWRWPPEPAEGHRGLDDDGEDRQRRPTPSPATNIQPIEVAGPSGRQAGEEQDATDMMASAPVRIHLNEPLRLTSAPARIELRMTPASRAGSVVPTRSG